MAVAKKKETGPIMLKLLRLETVQIPIVGETPLIIHKFSEKSKNQMLEKQMTNIRTKKEKKNPEEDYEGAFHRFPDGRYGFPANGFKGAIIAAYIVVVRQFG